MEATTVEASKLATDNGAGLHTASRTLACTYLGSGHEIPKGAQYIKWLPGWGHVSTDRMCVTCARSVGFIR